jgi:hypothetical protein
MHRRSRVIVAVASAILAGGLVLAGIAPAAFAGAADSGTRSYPGGRFVAEYEANSEKIARVGADGTSSDLLKKFDGLPMEAD